MINRINTKMRPTTEGVKLEAGEAGSDLISRSCDAVPGIRGTWLTWEWGKAGAGMCWAGLG